jgi:hypothetical protein
MHDSSSVTDTKVTGAVPHVNFYWNRALYTVLEIQIIMTSVIS